MILGQYHSSNIVVAFGFAFISFPSSEIMCVCIIEKKEQKGEKIAVAGDRTRVTRVTGGNTYHYTTTTLIFTFMGKIL